MKQYQPFRFKQFTIAQNNAAMKVGTDSVLLGAWAVVNPKEKILDIGAGTGLLSLMLAQKVSGNCHIDAVEIDVGAIEDAQLNFDLSPWKKSLFLHQADFNEYSPSTLYEVIISNPPFFEGLAPENVTRSIARSAGDKLSYENLITGASKLLNEGGRFYLILPIESFEKVSNLTSANSLILVNQMNIKPKQNKGINRVLVEFIKLSNRYLELELKINEMVIRNEFNKYTQAHITFTKDYYLDL